VAGLGIPVQRDPTILTAHPLIFFLEPLINSQLLLAADILQHSAVVRDSVIAEVGDKRAGELRAIGTPLNPRLIRGTLSYLALLAVGHKAALTETPVTSDFLRGHLQAFGQVLKQLLKSLPLLVMPGAIYSAGSTVESADGS